MQPVVQAEQAGGDALDRVVLLGRARRKGQEGAERHMLEEGGDERAAQGHNPRRAAQSYLWGAARIIRQEGGGLHEAIGALHANMASQVGLGEKAGERRVRVLDCQPEWHQHLEHNILGR